MERPAASGWQCARSQSSSAGAASGPPPGAATSTCGPALEYLAWQPSAVVAATAITRPERAGKGSADGLASLPATVVTTTPCSRAYLSAARTLGTSLAPTYGANSRLMLITSA